MFQDEKAPRRSTVSAAGSLHNNGVLAADTRTPGFFACQVTYGIMFALVMDETVL